MSDCLFTIPVKITGPQGLAFCSKHFNRFFFTHIIPLPSISSRPSRPKQLVHAGARQLAHFQLPRRHGRQLREDASRTNPGGLGEVINPQKNNKRNPYCWVMTLGLHPETSVIFLGCIWHVLMEKKGGTMVFIHKNRVSKQWL